MMSAILCMIWSTPLLAASNQPLEQLIEAVALQEAAEAEALITQIYTLMSEGQALSIEQHGVLWLAQGVHASNTENPRAKLMFSAAKRNGQEWDISYGPPADEVGLIFTSAEVSTNIGTLFVDPKLFSSGKLYLDGVLQEGPTIESPHGAYHLRIQPTLARKGHATNIIIQSKIPVVPDPVDLRRDLVSAWSISALSTAALSSLSYLTAMQLSREILSDYGTGSEELYPRYKLFKISTFASLGLTVGFTYQHLRWARKKQSS